MREEARMFTFYEQSSKAYSVIVSCKLYCSIVIGFWVGRYVMGHGTTMGHGIEDEPLLLFRGQLIFIISFVC